MKKLFIFALQPFSWEVERIKEEAEKAHLDVLVIDYFDTSFLDRFIVPDYVILRGVFDHSLGLDAHKEQHVLLDKFVHTDAHVLNDTILKIQPFTKKIQQDMAVQYSLPSIETHIYSTFEQMENDPHWQVWPRVAKPNQGSCGIGVVKLENTEAAADYFRMNSISDYVFQEVMEQGKDLRVMVVGEKIVGAMLRSAKPGNFVSNFSQGGTVASYQADDQIRAIIRATQERFSLEYAGIDLIRDLSGNWRLLEINRAAQFRGFEQATKTNVAKAIIDYIVAKA